MQSVGVKANAWQRGNAVTDLDPQGLPIRADAPATLSLALK
jgi:hypothetical protein